MRTLITSFAAPLAAFLLPTSTTFAADNCKLKQVTSVPASLIDGGLAVDVTLNGLPVKMWFTTNSDVSAINEAFAKRADMPLTDLHTDIYSTGRRHRNQMTRISSMQLGNATSTSAPFVVIPEGSDGTDGMPVGSIATDYISNYDVDIDISNGKINLFDRDHCKGQVVYWAQEYLASPIYLSNTGLARRPEMDVVADGQTFRAMIATGFGSNVLRQAVAEGRLGLVAGSAQMPKSGTWRDSDDRVADRYSHTFGSLSFGEITLHNSTVRVEPINMGAASQSIGSHMAEGNIQQPDMYIGMSFLKKLHIYIAYSENMIYYTVAPTSQ